MAWLSGYKILLIFPNLNLNTKNSSLNHSAPCMGIRLFAILYGPEFIIEPGGDRAGIAVFTVLIDMSRFPVVYLFYGRNDGCRTAGANFIEFGKLLNGNFPYLNCHPQFFCQNLEAFVRYGREDGMRGWCYIGITFYAEKVCRACFVNIFLFASIQK